MRQVPVLSSAVPGVPAPRPLRSARSPGVRAVLTGAVLLLVAGLRIARAEEALAAAESLPPQRIEAILAGQGYVGISDLRRRGSVWIADVAERDGRRYRAVVDGASGEVFGLRQMPWPRPGRAGPEADPPVR